MKNFCQNVLSHGRVTEDELFRFIGEYLDLKGKTFTGQDIPQIVYAIRANLFSLDYAINEYCRLKDFQVYKLYNNQRLVKAWIE